MQVASSVEGGGKRFHLQMHFLRIGSQTGISSTVQPVVMHVFAGTGHWQSAMLRINSGGTDRETHDCLLDRQLVRLGLHSALQGTGWRRSAYLRFQLPIVLETNRASFALFQINRKCRFHLYFILYILISFQQVLHSEVIQAERPPRIRGSWQRKIAQAKIVSLQRKSLHQISLGCQVHKTAVAEANIYRVHAGITG